MKLAFRHRGHPHPGDPMSTSFLPGVADELRERVAVEIVRQQVRRALRDTFHATGHTQDLRARYGNLGALPAGGFLRGGGSEHRAG